MQRPIQSPIKHLRKSFYGEIVNGFQLLTMFGKRSTVHQFNDKPLDYDVSVSSQNV